MKNLRLVFLGVFAFVLMGATASLHADTIQIPVMDVSDPPCSEGQICPSLVGPGMGFTFTINSNGGGMFQGTNRRETWTSLRFELPAHGINPMDISCTSGATTGHAPFASPCQAFFADDSHMTIALVYTTFCGEFCGPFPGIPFNDIFTVNMNDPGMPFGHWFPGDKVRAFVNNDFVDDNHLVALTPLGVPEPASLTLLAIGLGAFLVKRKVRA